MRVRVRNHVEQSPLRPCPIVGFQNLGSLPGAKTRKCGETMSQPSVTHPSDCPSNILSTTVITSRLRRPEPLQNVARGKTKTKTRAVKKDSVNRPEKRERQGLRTMVLCRHRKPKQQQPQQDPAFPIRRQVPPFLCARSQRPAWAFDAFLGRRQNAAPATERGSGGGVITSVTAGRLVRTTITTSRASEGLSLITLSRAPGQKLGHRRFSARFFFSSNCFHFDVLFPFDRRLCAGRDCPPPPALPDGQSRDGVA